MFQRIQSTSMERNNSHISFISFLLSSAAELQFNTTKKKPVGFGGGKAQKFFLSHLKSWYTIAMAPKALLILLISFVLLFFCGLTRRNKHKVISKPANCVTVKKNRNSPCKLSLWEGNIISSACLTIILTETAGAIYTNKEIHYWYEQACSWLKPDYAANQIPVSGKGSLYSSLRSLVIAASWQILIIERLSLLYFKITSVLWPYTILQ